jgi:hypothetical protein
VGDGADQAVGVEFDGVARSLLMARRVYRRRIRARVAFMD